MNQRELLRKSIEEERSRLNDLIASGAKVEETYQQSLLVDQLLEQYLDCEA